MGIHVIVDSLPVFERCNDKYNLFKYLSAQNIVVPRFVLGSNKQEYNQIDYYPVVIKPRANTYASNKVMLAFSLDELVLLTDLFDLRGIDYIIQEWKGNSCDEYSISVTCDSDGNVVGAIAMQRIFESGFMIKSNEKKDNNRYIVSSGISSGKIVNNSELLNQAKNIALALECKGSLNLQGVWDNGCFWLIDAHSAITGSVYSKALAGYNEPVYYIKKYVLKEPYDFKSNEIIIKKRICTEMYDGNPHK